MTIHATRQITAMTSKVGTHIPPYPPIAPYPFIQPPLAVPPFIMFPFCAKAIPLVSTLAQNGNMMNGGTASGGWMNGYGTMGGYGGIWVPTLLVIAVVGLVVWIVMQKRK